MQGREVATRVIGIGALILSTAGMAAAQPIFESASTYPLGASTGSQLAVLAIADVGAPTGSGAPDGIPDLITANQESLVVVLLGRADGTFTTGPSNPLTGTPTALAAADFNGDTFVDLLVADTSDAVTFLAGNSNGPPFEDPGPPIPAGHSPVAIATGKLDGDANLDAVVLGGGAGNSGSVTILLGNGNGTFRQGTTIPTGAGSQALVLGDFNGDQKLDMAVVNTDTNDVTILRGDGAGGFIVTGTAMVGDAPAAIAARDLNGDQHLDLVVVDQNADNIAVLDGNPDGSFKPARFYTSGATGSQPSALALADLNLDGKVDVVTANHLTCDASVLLGDGAGGFSAPRAFVADQEPLTVGVADFNKDGAPDVVAVNQGPDAGPDAAVLLGRGDGSLLAAEHVIGEQNPAALTAGDLDNDGRPDLVVAESSGNLQIYRATVSGGFAAPVTMQSPSAAVAIGNGDFNADGQQDIVTLNQSSKNVSLFLGRAQGGFDAAGAFSVGAAPSSLAVADFNRDGRSDVAVTLQPSGSAGSVAVLLAAPDGSLGAAMSFPVGSNPLGIDYGDFNKDGKLDLVVANNTSNTLSILLGNGDGTFQAATTVPSIASPRAVAVADFDRDGNDDVAVARLMMLGVVVLYGNGQGAFPAQSQTLSLGAGHPVALMGRDLTGDFIPDVGVADDTGNLLAVFVSSGSTRQFQRQTISLGRGPSGVVGADFNGDGRYDAATVDKFASAASVLSNIRATAVLRGDGNGDGRVSAADAIAVIRELGDGRGTRIEDTRIPGGGYAAAPGVDANGDGLVTPQDALAVAHRLFPGM